MKFFTRSLSIFLLLIVLLHIASFSAMAFRLSGTEYTPLLDFCREHGIGLNWDPVSRVAVLKDSGRAITLRPGSNVMVTDTSSLSFDSEPLFYQGAVAVPEAIKEAIGRYFALYPDGGVRDSYGQNLVAQPAQCHLVKKIVIDPGHGGKDPGAIGRGGIYEKDIVLDIGKRLKRELERNGIEAILTRDTDRFIPLWKRAKIANDENADFFISIHANSAKSRWARGFEIFYLSEKPTDDESRALAAAENSVLEFEEDKFAYHSTNLDAILSDLSYDEFRRESKELAEYTCVNVCDPLKLKDRGVKGARFYVLKGANMPAILIETGFVTNVSDVNKLSDPAFRKEFASELAKAIMKYKREYEINNGFTR